MLENRYIGIVNEEVSRLVISRARRFRVPRDRADDLQQEMMPTLAAFRYDAARSNGASLQTALIAVIDRQIKAYLRAECRYQAHVERLRELSFSAGPAAPPEHIDLGIDVANVVATLPQREQRICSLLGDHRDVRFIARSLGCGRDTVCRSIERIRRAFSKAGLEAWIDPDHDLAAAEA